MPTVRPLILAMVLCDEVHVDPSTGKRFIMGTFTALTADRFPIVMPTLRVYVAATGGRGLVTLDLIVTDVDGEPIPGLERPIELDVDDPRSTYELAFSFDDFVVPEPGEFRFQLFAGEQFLGERRLEFLPNAEASDE